MELTPIDGMLPMSLDPAVRDATLNVIPKLRATAILLCGSVEQGDNLVQGVLQRCSPEISSLDPQSEISSGLSAMLHNRLYSELRLRRLIGHERPAKTAEKPEELSMRAVLARYTELRTSLAELSDEEREALTLIEAAGLSYAEAAEICGCSGDTIKSRVQRGRTRLAKPRYESPAGLSNIYL
jgi:RNA polymerase sigma-70 factor (ECF subfamily)